MNVSSRRKLVQVALASSVAVGLSPARSLWAMPRRADRSYESRLTGSVIELIDDDAEFSPEFYAYEEERDYTREAIALTTAAASMEIEFVQTSLAPEEYLEVVQDRYRENWDVVQLADSGSNADGAWFAAAVHMEKSQHYPNGIPLSSYCEYQAGAYDTADLVISVNAHPDRFAEGISSAQSDVAIGDWEPLLMLESSEVLALAFPATGLTAESSPGNESTGSSSRRSRGTSGDDSTSTNEQSGTQQSSASDNDYLNSVRDHRTEFISEFETLAAGLAVFVDDTATESDQIAALETIGSVAGGWLDYSTRAAQLTAPTDLADLESLYLHWAGEIVSLGNAWFAAIDGTGTFDQFFDQIDVVDQADHALVAELNSLGAGPGPERRGPLQLDGTISAPLALELRGLNPTQGTHTTFGRQSTRLRSR